MAKRKAWSEKALWNGQIQSEKRLRKGQSRSARNQKPELRDGPKPRVREALTKNDLIQFLKRSPPLLKSKSQLLNQIPKHLPRLRTNISQSFRVIERKGPYSTSPNSCQRHQFRRLASSLSINKLRTETSPKSKPRRTCEWRVDLQSDKSK